MPDVAPLVQESSSAAPGSNRVLVPKAGVLSFPLPAPNQDELSTVNAVVKIYNESHRGFEFAVVQGTSLLHVVPRQMTGLSGNLEPVKPILDTVITIEPREPTSYALIEEICKKISINTNTNVGMGTVPTNMLIQTKTSIGGSGKTTRSILAQWILENGAGLSLSWLLLYYPQEYSLNISWVAPVDKR